MALTINPHLYRQLGGGLNWIEIHWIRSMAVPLWVKSTNWCVKGTWKTRTSPSATLSLTKWRSISIYMLRALMLNWIWWHVYNTNIITKYKGGYSDCGIKLSHEASYPTSVGHNIWNSSLYSVPALELATIFCLPTNKILSQKYTITRCWFLRAGTTCPVGIWICRQINDRYIWRPKEMVPLIHLSMRLSDVKCFLWCTSVCVWEWEIYGFGEAENVFGFVNAKFCSGLNGVCVWVKRGGEQGRAQ